MAQLASRSRPFMLIEPIFRVIGGVAAVVGMLVLVCRDFLSLMVNCCLCFWGEYVSLPTILLVLALASLFLIVELVRRTIVNVDKI